MDSVVLKFGGTSVQDAAALRRLCSIVAAEHRPRVVIVSALAGVTDTLCELAAGTLRGAAAGAAMHRLLERHIGIVREMVAGQVQAPLTSRLRRRFEEATSFNITDSSGRDALLAIGELASSDLVTAVLEAAGIPATWVDAHDVIITDDTFGHARPDHDGIRAAAKRTLSPLLASGRVAVIGGFVGCSKQGATTTLGRGGSDYSAALVGAAIEAQEIQIWTDVDGVLTSDPRVVAGATLVPELTFHEAYDLARFGAKVLHWGTLEPAASQDIPVRVLNSRRPGAAGTTITARVNRPAPVVVGLAHQMNATITVADSRVVGVSAAGRALPCLTGAVDDLAGARIVRDAAIVAAVGEGIAGHAPLWSLLTAAANGAAVESLIATQSGHAIVCLAHREHARKLLSRWHDTLFAAVHA